MEKIIDIEDLVPDSKNFNIGTEQGRELMERSLSELGAGRSVLVDKNNILIAGNKTQEAAIKAGIRKVRVVETTGDELVAVRRIDVDIDTKKGRDLAFVDNLSTQVSLAWDTEQLEQVQADVEGFDIADFGFDIEDLPQVTFPTAGQGEGDMEEPTDLDMTDEERANREQDLSVKLTFKTKEEMQTFLEKYQTNIASEYNVMITVHGGAL